METVAIACFLLLIIGKADLFIVLEEDGGYSNILVAISENTPQPDDGGENLIELLKELLTESSRVLHEATDTKVFFKEISILIPSQWGIEGTVSTRLSSNQADIRLSKGQSNLTGSLPYTLHSGKCGVAGNFITLPIEYLEDLEESVVARAKGMIQQWAQFRYGVFEEHGYPGDSLLPYFYRHPDGYDAVTSSNDTDINGDLKSLSGDDCEIDENGVISDHKNCSFVPYNNQTATSSLMSFHWLESVTDFSDKHNHDRRPPHRQNRLCGSRSSKEIIMASPDLNTTQPNPDQDPVPKFLLLQKSVFPVVYLAIDTSTPTSTANAGTQGQNVFKQGLRNLFTYLSSYPDLYVAWSTFENIDPGAVDSYLKEEIPPTRLDQESQLLFAEKVNKFNYTNIVTRDVSAAVRDAERRLRKYKDIGGSILYITTSTKSVTKDTVIETDMAEKLLLNNIKLVVAESGPGSKALSRFSVVCQGSYYFAEYWGSTAFFTPINQEIERLCRNGLKNERRIITSRKDFIRTDNQLTGTFSIDKTVGTNTTLVLRSPTVGLFNVTLTNPDGQQLVLENEPETKNWNAQESAVSVTWKRISGLTAIGRWSYTVNYDTSLCNDCETEPEIQLQIGSSKRNSTSDPLPTFHPWVSLTPGFEYVDFPKNPSVIQVWFESVTGRIGDLFVTADIILDSDVLETVSLTDTGTMDSDISKDGIYSGIFYPVTNGNYTVNFRAVSVESASGTNKFISSDQGAYCCGSIIPTATLADFQMTVNEALDFEVRNAMEWTPQEALPIVSDFQANTYGVDQDQVYVALTWTVPLNTSSQLVRYSENYTELLDATETANETQVVYGTLEDVEAGTFIFVYVAAPYNPGKNVYFAVEITVNDDQKTRSHITWTEPNPPKFVFTTPEYSSTSEITSDPSTFSPTDTSPSISSESPSTSPTEDTSSTQFTSPDTTIETTESITDSSTTFSSTTDLTSSSSDNTSTDEIDSTTDPTTTSNQYSTTTDSTTMDLTSTDTTLTDSTTTDLTTTNSTTTYTTTIESTTMDSTTAFTTTTESITSDTTPFDTTTIESTTTDSTTAEITTSDTTPSSTTTVDSTPTGTTTTESTITSSTSSSSTADPGDGDKEGLTSAEIGYIVGGVISGVLVIAIAVGGFIYLRKKKNVNSFTDNSATHFSNPAPVTNYNDNQQDNLSSSSIPSSGEHSSTFGDIDFTIEDGDIVLTAL